MLEFKEPPKSGRDARSDKWKDIAFYLKAEPGEWAYVGEYSPGVPAQIRRGEYPAFIDPSSSLPPRTQMELFWDVTTRKADRVGRRCDLYIRYIG